MEIKFCINDIGPHKKLIPTLKLFPDAIIVTADDDSIYDEFWLRDLYNGYFLNSNCANAFYTRSLSSKSYDFDKSVITYGVIRDTFLIPGGGAGVLLTKNMLHDDWNDEKLAMKLCPKGNDFWMAFMLYLKETPIYNSGLRPFGSFKTIEDTQSSSLWSVNRFGLFDIQLKTMLKYYNICPNIIYNCCLCKQECNIEPSKKILEKTKNFTKIFYYPKIKFVKNNPIMHFMYGNLSENFLVNGISDNSELLAGEMGYNNSCLHMHWLDNICSLSNEKTSDFLESIKTYKEDGGKVIWTMHNILPHELDVVLSENSEFDSENVKKTISIHNFISKNSDLIHLHSLEAYEKAKKFYDIDLKKCFVIPHGSYENFYPPSNSDTIKVIREQFGILESDFVFGYFGNVKKYKNVGFLINEFNKTFLDKQGVKLFIVGKFDKQEEHLLKKQSNNILIQNEFVNESKVSSYFDLFSIAVYPSICYTTSGVLALYITMNKIILCKKNEILNEKSSFFFDDKLNGLGSVMEKVFRTDKNILSKMVLETNKIQKDISFEKLSISWNKIFKL